MKRKLFTVLASGAFLLVVSGTLFAHHAGTLYDREHAVTLTGTVTEFMFTNTHAQIHFEVKDEGGSVTRWVAETAGPQRLLRSGWNKFTLKAGDQITVTGAPLKDGRRFVSIFRLTGGKAPVLTLGAE